MEINNNHITTTNTPHTKTPPPTTSSPATCNFLTNSSQTNSSTATHYPSPQSQAEFGLDGGMMPLNHSVANGCIRTLDHQELLQTKTTSLMPATNFIQSGKTLPVQPVSSIASSLAQTHSSVLSVLRSHTKLRCGFEVILSIRNAIRLQ